MSALYCWYDILAAAGMIDFLLFLFLVLPAFPFQHVLALVGNPAAAGILVVSGIFALAGDPAVSGIPEVVCMPAAVCIPAVAGIPACVRC